MKKRPNILLFMTDNQPADLLGCYGNTEIETPHLDRLASQGLKFDKAFCVNGMCSPCRASVMTGLMPSQHGIHTWIDDRQSHKWPPNWNAIGEFETLPGILAAQGYKTALIGKYHMGSPFNAQNGFQHWVTFPHGHTTNFYGNTFIDNGRQYPFAGHSVDFFTDKTIDYLDAIDADDQHPHFIFVPYNSPYGHWPALKGRAKNNFRARYDQCNMHSIPREGIHPAALARYLKKATDSTGGIDHSSEILIPNDLETLRNYYSEMSLVDDGVGRILEALSRNALDDNTLVVYTADHGFSLGHHGIWGHSQATLPANAHRETFSIPLIFRHTDRLASGVSEAGISQIDLFSTLLDYVGISPLGHNDKVAARSFVPMLQGRPQAWDNEVYMEQEEMRAVRNERWLFVKQFSGAPHYAFKDELYDLRADPGEKHNLIDDPGCAEVIEALGQKVTAFFDRYAVKEYDLWHGGGVKSTSDKPWLWKDAWGEQWTPGIDQHQQSQ